MTINTFATAGFVLAFATNAAGQPPAPPEASPEVPPEVPSEVPSEAPSEAQPSTVAPAEISAAAPPPAVPESPVSSTNGDAPPPASTEDSVDFATDADPQDPVRFTESEAERDPVEFSSPTAEQLPEGIDFSTAGGKAPMLDAAEVTVAPVAPFTGTPQRFAIEVKFGPYLPSVDADYPGPGLGAYADVFGKTNSRGVAVGQPRDRLMTQLGFEWQFVNVGGPLSIGTSIGFFQARAQALLVQTQPADPTVRSDADRVRFSVMPFTLLLGYRFELLADRFKVPLVPYARGGLAYGIWWAGNGDGDVSVNDAGVKGRGGSAGWQVNLGMMLRLDFLEPSAAKALDSATGINHTYIMGEWQFSRMDGFGSLMNKVSVGDDTWYLGLAIEI